MRCPRRNRLRRARGRARQRHRPPRSQAGQHQDRADGTLKLLDFGLATIRDDGETSTDGPAATRSRIDTTTGNVMGTPTYMAPEQVRGEVIDTRADIWAFGCVLYEMLTAMPVFRGATIADTFGAIVTRDPDWTMLPPATPVGIRALLRLCLKKDRKRRLMHIADAHIWIDDATAYPAVDREPAIRSASHRTRMVGGGALGCGRCVLGADLLSIDARRRARTARPDQHAARIRRLLAVAVARRAEDCVSGRRRRQDAAVAACARFTGRDAVAGNRRRDVSILVTERRFSRVFADGQLKRADVVGGVPVGACSERRWAAARPGTRTTSSSMRRPVRDRYYKIPATGGEPVAVTQVEPGHMSHRFPQFLPDGNHFIFFAAGSSPGSTSDRSPAARASGSSAPRRLESSPLPGTCSSMREGALFAQRFDLQALELRDQPVPVAEQVAGELGRVPRRIHGELECRGLPHRRRRRAAPARRGSIAREKSWIPSARRTRACLPV